MNGNRELIGLLLVALYITVGSHLAMGYYLKYKKAYVLALIYGIIIGANLYVCINVKVVKKNGCYDYIIYGSNPELKSSGGIFGGSYYDHQMDKAFYKCDCLEYDWFGFYTHRDFNSDSTRKGHF